MADAIAHRGPDGSGVWVDEGADLALSHRRLSIQDLTEAGAQPMSSASGRYVIAFNGEVYNFRVLRAELEGLGYAFRGGSDTEIMLAAFEQWGLEASLHRFVGMFAFALWDREARTLALARDRLGIKPLYVGRVAGGLIFGSDLASFHRVPRFEARINREVVREFARYGCVPGTSCIYHGCEKVPPGTVLTYRDPSEPPTHTTWWELTGVAAEGLESRLDLGLEAAVERVEHTLREAVADRQIADVPLGVFLSGGIDSSLVAAMMRASGAPTRTFSIGFEEAAYDEATHAREVAGHLGTDHTELILSPAEAMGAIPRLGAIYTEPFADSSQIPTLLVCELARRDVAVVLSGDGGDEVFGGYNRHVFGPRVHGTLSRVPRRVRGLLAKLLRARSPAAWDRLAQRAAALGLPTVRTPGDKVHKLAGLLDARDAESLYQHLVSVWQRPERLILGVDGARPPARALPPGLSIAEQYMLRDMLGYLHDDILTKVDRASMSVALEVRVPLLDHRLVELGWRLPESLKIGPGSTGKRVLRALLARHVPAALFERPKMGFGVPVDAWLRGPLRGWAEDLLDPVRLREDGLLDPAAVRSCWEAHLSGRGAVQHALWAVLMLQAWRRAQPGTL